MLTANIRGFIKKSTFLFAVFILTQVVSVIAVEYSFLKFRNYQIEVSTYNGGVASFTVNFKEDTTYKNVSKDIENIEKIVSVSLRQSYLNIQGEIDTRAYSFGQNQGILYGRNFKKDNEIVIGHNLYENEKLKVNDKILIDNSEYIISGVRFFDYNEIPIGALKPSSAIKSLVVETDKIPSNSETNLIVGELQESFPESDILPPAQRDFLSEYTFDTTTATTFLLLLLSIINISYVYKVIITKRNKYYAVSLCCGATFRKMKLYLLAESLIYGAVSIIIGTLIFKGLLFNILFYENRFSSLDYCFSIICCVSIIIVPIIVALISFSTKSIKELVYNRG